MANDYTAVPERLCPHCGQSSLRAPFYVRKNGRLSTYCIECEKDKAAERYTDRKNNLAHKVGILCLCGCGQITRVSTSSDRNRAIKVGDPLPYIYGHSRRLSSVEYVIEDRGYKTPCWIWQLSKDDEGYGFITVPPRESGSRSGRAHAVYYERRFGPIPEGMIPDHLCRVHSCVNPDHIEPVTPAVNTRRGLSAKLDEQAVAEIRRALRLGEKQYSLAERFGVTQTMVSRIKLNKAWVGVE
jgi:hypothetical protein